MNKKWLLGLGGVAAISLPVSAVIACGDKKTETPPVENKETTAFTKAKTDAKAFVNGLTYPTQDDVAHDASLFSAIATTKQAALTTIDGATTAQQATAMASSATEGTEITKVLSAINTYNNSTVTKAGDDKTKQDVAQSLTKAKKDAKAFVNGLTYPTQDDVAHDASLFSAIATTKQAALKTIDGATTVQQATAMASSATEGAEITKVISAIDAYTASKGTDAAKKAAAVELVTAKEEAKKLVNDFVAKTHQDDATHEASLFGEIATAQEKVITDIDNATDKAAVEAIAKSETKGTGILAIKAAIDTYIASKETDAAKKAAAELAKAKATANKFIVNLDLPDSDDTLHKPSLYNVIFKVWNAAKEAIKSADTPEQATKIASSKTEGTGIEKILLAIKAYNSSTLTDAEKNLILAKNNALEFLKSWSNKAKFDDNPLHFMNISKLSKRGATAINNAKSIEEVKKLASSKTEGTLIVEMKKAVEDFNAS